VSGNTHTHLHDRLVRELAVGAGAAVVFYGYGLEVRYPVTIEQDNTVAQWVVEQGASKDPAAAGSPWPATLLAVTWLPRSTRWRIGAVRRGLGWSWCATPGVVGPRAREGRG
jgi:hypothetical protein